MRYIERTNKRLKEVTAFLKMAGWEREPVTGIIAFRKHPCAIRYYEEHRQWAGPSHENKLLDILNKEFIDI